MKYWHFKPVGSKVVVCIGLVFLAACAPRSRMMDVPDATVQSTPNPTEAMVVFMRPTFVNQGQASSLFDVTEETPKFIGILRAWKKIAYPVTPGKHRFMMVITAGRADFVIADLAKGKRYYVRVTASGGVPNLSFKPYRKAELDSSALSEDLKDTAWVVNTPNSRDWAARHMSSITKKAGTFARWSRRRGRPTLRPEDGI